MVVLCDTRGTRRQDVAVLNCCVGQLLLSGEGEEGGGHHSRWVQPLFPQAARGLGCHQCKHHASVYSTRSCLAMRRPGAN